MMNDVNKMSDKEIATRFLKKHFIKSDVKYCNMSSYRLKHVLQYSTNVYMTEPDFILLMEKLGYEKTSKKNYWKMTLSPEITKFIKEREIGL